MGDARVFLEGAEVAVGDQDTDARVSVTGAEAAVTGQTTDTRVFAESVQIALLIAGVEPLTPPSIGSSEAFGTPTVYQPIIAPGAVASGEAFGSPTVVQGEPNPQPPSIPSAEAFGFPTLAGQGYVLPTAIASEEAVPGPLVQSPRKVSPVGIPGADQPGNPSVTGPTVAKTKLIRLNPGHQGIPSGEAVGTPTLTNKRVAPGAIASGEVFGTPHIIQPQFVTLTGIASAEAFGAPSIARPGTVIPNTIASAEAFGTPTIVRAGTIAPTSIASSEAVGTPTILTLEQTVLPIAIASSEAFGTPTIVRQATHVITPTGIGTGLTFGTPTIIGAPNAPILPSSIISRESFGLPRITVGIPEGPDNYPPGRIANRLYDPETGVAFAFAINHSDEEPRSFARTYEAGAPTTVGLVRHQSAADLVHLVFRGLILDPAQKTAADALFDHCDEYTLIYEDYSGEAYEVIITTWDCRPERARNPHTRGLVMWRYTMDLAILRVLHGALNDTVGNPPSVPPDIVVEAPSTPIQPVGIVSKQAFGSLIVSGGSTVLVPTAVRPASAFGSVIVVGGTAPGGGGAGEGGGSSIPAAFPSRLRASGTRIADANGYILNRMTGVNIHCLPDYIPSQDDLHQIKARGGSWVRVVLHWNRLESTQGVLNATMRTQIDNLLARLQVAGLYAELELHLNVGTTPSWTTGSDETAKYAAHGQFITQALAQRYGTNKVVFGFGLNEIPAYQATLDYGNGAIPYLETVQRQMISWMRVSAPDWIGVVTLGYSNQTPFPDSPRTAASPTAYNAVGGNVVLDVHPYQAGVNSSDPSHDGRQPNGMIYPTYQGGLAYWMISDYPIAYVDTAVHRAQMAAFLADYVTFCNAAQIPLMAGEVGWPVNNTGGKAAWWASQYAALAGANPAMAAQWIFSSAVPPQEYWPARPGGVWDPYVEKLLSGVW